MTLETFKIIIKSTWTLFLLQTLIYNLHDFSCVSSNFVLILKHLQRNFRRCYLSPVNQWLKNPGMSGVTQKISRKQYYIKIGL